MIRFRQRELCSASACPTVSTATCCRDRTGSTSEAVVTGSGRTGRLVTSAALILFLAMAALASAPFTFLKIFATGVGAGILLDATIVRCLLVPALVCLFGRWNWWLPAWAATLLRVKSSPLPGKAREPAVAPAQNTSRSVRAVSGATDS
jgi:putative drug exporter of the RND superfamily